MDSHNIIDFDAQCQTAVTLSKICQIPNFCSQTKMSVKHAAWQPHQKANIYGTNLVSDLSLQILTKINTL